MLAALAALLAACTSTFTGNLRETYDTVKTGDVERRGLTSRLEVGAEGSLGPELDYRVGDRFIRTDQTLDSPAGDADETQTVHQPAVETVLTSGALRWTQSLELQDTSTRSSFAPDNDRLRSLMLQKVELAPAEWPRLTARLDRRTDEDDQFTDREEIYTVLQVDDARGPFEWIYAFETQSLTDDRGGSDRKGLENRFRGIWRDELLDGNLFATVTVNARFREDTQTLGGPNTGVPPGEVFPSQGLSLVDTTPTFSVLASTPALIDGDETTPTGINIGGFASGGQTSWNIGVGLGVNETVDQILLATETVVPPLLVSQFSFSVWTSNDNSTWTLVQGSASYSYDDAGQRFRITFPPVTGLFLKIVNDASPPGAPAVDITEMRVFSPGVAPPSSSEDVRDLYEHNARSNLSWLATDALTVTWDLLAQVAGNENNGLTTRDETRIDNTLGALWAVAERVDISLRAETKDIRDDVRPDDYSAILGGTVEYRPLETLDFGASHTWTEREYAPTGDIRSRVSQLRSSARLTEELEAEISYQHQIQEDDGQDVQTDRDIIAAGIVARLYPRLDLTLGYSHDVAERTGSGAAGVPDPTSDNWELVALWRATNLLIAEVRLVYRDAISGTGLDQNYRLDWSPLPDGSVDIQANVQRRVDGIQDLTTDTYSVLAQWRINAKARFSTNYAVQIPEDTDRTDLLSISLILSY